MQYLRQALRYDGQENPVLVFTGIGGMGKTALRVAFEEQYLKSKKVPFAVNLYLIAITYVARNLPIQVSESYCEESMKTEIIRRL